MQVLIKILALFQAQSRKIVSSALLEYSLYCKLQSSGISFAEALGAVFLLWNIFYFIYYYYYLFILFMACGVTGLSNGGW